MISSKYVRNRLKKHLKGVKEIRALEEIQTSYSHAKVWKILSFTNLQKLFQLFVAEHKDNFLSKFSGTKHDCYKQALDDLTTWHKRKQEASD